MVVRVWSERGTWSVLFEGYCVGCFVGRRSWVVSFEVEIVVFVGRR